MTDQAKNEAQPVIDAVVVGDARRLTLALRCLAKALPAVFLRVTGQLLDTNQREFVSGLCIGGGYTSDFYHADSKVFGAVYTDTGMFTRQAGRSGAGLDYQEVKKIVLEIRADYDEAVFKKVLELDGTLADLDKLLAGHSCADRKILSLAYGDLARCQALLWAALNPKGRASSDESAPDIVQNQFATSSERHFPA
jgi:hypothetical protein